MKLILILRLPYFKHTVFIMFATLVIKGTFLPLLFLLSTLFILSACMDTTEVPPSNEEKSTIKILDNKADAQDAQDEYKKLQAQRVQE